MDNSSFLVNDRSLSIFGKCFLFSRLVTSFDIICFFKVTCSENHFNNVTVAVLLQAIRNCYVQNQENFFCISSIQQVLNHMDWVFNFVRTRHSDQKSYFESKTFQPVSCWFKKRSKRPILNGNLKHVPDYDFNFSNIVSYGENFHPKHQVLQSFLTWNLHILQLLCFFLKKWVF